MDTLNKIFIVGELVILAMPLSILLAMVGLPQAIRQLFESYGTETMLIGIVALASAVATSAVWWLALKFVRGQEVANLEHRWGWLLVLVGGGVVILSYSSQYLPQPEPYSEGWWFYDQLGTFVLGAPLVVPAIHVFLSSFLRVRR